MAFKADKDTFKVRIKDGGDPYIIEPDFDDDTSFECFYNGSDFDVVVYSFNVDSKKIAKLKEKYTHIKSEKDVDIG